MAFTISQLAILVPVLILLHVIGKTIYNIFFHPLAKFPGPFLAKVTNAWYGLSWCGGRYPLDIAAMHEKYGDIVRIAPGELSFGNVESYKDIYGHATKDKRPFLKSTWYEIPDNDGSDNGLVFERDPHKHALVRKSVAHGFSAQALRLQTELVCQYIDLFIEQLHKYGTQKEGVPIQEWYNWLTFDIIGDLAFGESFGAVAEAKPNFWISTVCDSIHAISMCEVIRRLPLLKPLERFIWRDLNNTRAQFVELTLQKARGRMTQENSRDDFFSHILSDKKNKITEGYLCIQAQTLITAGSETTATFLAAVTYYLNTNPTTLHRLQDEVRQEFRDSSAINSDSTANLSYLGAVIEEGLRMYAPVAFGLPRISPGAEVNGHFIPAGTTVHTCIWQTNTTNKYWHDPAGFHPERWLPAGHAFHNPVFDGDCKTASQPFSLGSRACIGKNLAYMEMRIIISKLVWHFNMELVAKNIDWYNDSRFYSLWNKPDLMTRFNPV